MKLHRETHCLEADDCNLSGSVMTNVNLSGWRLERINMSGWSVQDSNLSGLRIDDANLSGAQLSKVNLMGASIRDGLYEGMTIDGISVPELLALYAKSKNSAPDALPSG